MPLGIYKAVKRRKEVNSTALFTYNLQIWLAIFAFTSFIIAAIAPPLWRWGMMLSELTFSEWFAFILGSIIVFFFAVMGIYAFISLFLLAWRCIFGQVVEMNNLSANHLAATTPLKDKRSKKEYVKAIKILMENNDKLIKKNEELMSEYLAIVEKGNNQE